MSVKMKFILALQVANVIAFLYWFGKNEFADIFFIAVSVSCVFLSFVCAFLLYLYYEKKKELKNRKRLYSKLASTNDFSTIIGIVVEELRKRNKNVEFYEKKGYVLTTANTEINLFDPTNSAIAQAFFNLETINHEGSVFVPISFKPAGRPKPCWEMHDCSSKECKCHGKSLCKCWEKSGYIFRGTELLHWQDKLKKCFICPSFLPFCAFLIKGKKINWVCTFLREHSGIISTSYTRQKTYDHLCQKLDYYLLHDPIVKGLLNRKGLHEILHRSYEAAINLCLCMISINHFSEFSEECLALNTLYGELGSLLIKVRGSNIIARYGMEDFTIVFPHTDMKTAFEFCESLRKKIAEHTFCLNKKITVSIGIVDIEDATDPESLIEKVCVTLDSAKRIPNSVISTGIKNSPDIQRDYLAF